MLEVETILSGLGPAERTALTTRQATQQTADRLATKKLSRYVKGPPRRAYARTVKLTIELTPLGEDVVRRLHQDADADSGRRSEK